MSSASTDDEQARAEALLLRAYAAFTARDVDAVVAPMRHDVDWPNVSALRDGLVERMDVEPAA